MNKKTVIGALVLSVALGSSIAYSGTINLEKNIAQINSSIEKANYRGADDVIYKTLTEYKDNHEVQALAAVSWALQSKLELAQDQIDKLKNVIPRSSNLHFAQGVVFYKRMTSSNLEFRNKADSLFSCSRHTKFRRKNYFCDRTRSPRRFVAGKLYGNDGRIWNDCDAV